MIRRTFALAAALMLAATSASANVPSTITLEAALLSVGGGPAADGSYKLTVGLYKDAVGGLPMWSEGPAAIGVKGGGFSYLAGTINPLPAAALASTAQVWIGVAIDSDPELPRRPLSATPFALRASIAEGLECSGCVTPGMLDPKLLQGYAKTADLSKVASSGAFADLTGAPDLSQYVKSAGLSGVAFTGKYADLNGGPDLTPFAKSADLAKVASSGKYADLAGAPPLTACGSGLVVHGFKADGSLDCVPAGDASNLPPDALAKVSNGLLTDQIIDTIASTTTPVAIKDNNPIGVADSLTWPDYGTAQTVKISVDLSNSDIATLKLVLIPPDGSTLVLYDKGDKGEALKTSWNEKSVLISGTLAPWVGKNPKGKWTLAAIDTGFFNNAADGQINAWSLTVQTLSDKKVKANGLFQFVNADAPPLPCDAAQAGAAYYSPKDKALYICNGTDYYSLAVSIPGTSKETAALSCKDLLAKLPAAKDGPYWLNPDGSGAYQAWCDMTTDGGGWTLAMRMKNDATLGYASTYWTDAKVFNEDGAGSTDPTLNANAKSMAYVNLPGATLRGCKGAPGAGQCFQQTLGGSKTLQKVFTENFKPGGPSRSVVTGYWGDDGSQPYCNGTGINNAQEFGGPGSYSAARFGLVGNNENDCASTDSAWGFGVYGCSVTAKSCGAGAWYWQSGACGGNCTQGTLWLR